MKPKMFLASLALASSVAAPASGAIFIFDTRLSGPAEAPPNASPGFGAAIVTFDTTANTMLVQASFAGLIGNTTASHIHCCTAVPGAGTVSVATQTPSFSGFPLGVKAGSMNTLFDATLTSSFNAPFVTNNGGTAAGAFAALLAGATAGRAYFNVHSTAFPGGEIRGFLQPVPEPETYALLLAGLGLVGLAARRRRSAA